MRIIKPNGDIIELNTAEYRELFMQPKKAVMITPEAAEILKKAKAEFEEHLNKHPVELVPHEQLDKKPMADDPALTMGFKCIPNENASAQEAEIASQIEENPSVDKLADEGLSTQENAPKEEEPVIKRSTAKRKLDDGKIFALRRAGWKWDKIADEMGCSIQTAINHFNDYKENKRD